jgi:outer membrane protein
MTYSPFFALLLAAGLCGCEAARQARHAQTDGGRIRGETTVTAAEAGLTGSGPYALTNLEQIALHQHATILQAQQAVESARLQCRMTRSARFPQINAGGGYSRSTQNTQGGSSSAAMRGSRSGSVGLDLLLYDFGKLDAQERQALEALVAAEEQLRTSELDVAYAVRAAFFELHRSTELYRVALESERQYAEHLEEARVMVRVGTRRKYDATKAEVDWGNAALTVITVSNILVTAQAQLNRALGLAEYPSYSIRDDVMPPRAEPDARSLMALARERDPSLAVLRARARAASAAVDQTIAELYPDLSLGSDLSLAGRDFPLTWNFSWALRATQNLFDGYRKTDRIKDAVTQLRSARSRAADAEQVLFLEIVNAVAQYKSARKRLEISDLVARQATENRDIVNEQYRVGVSSSIERTDAQVAVTQAQADVVRARYDQQTAQARIARLTGEPIAIEEQQGNP